MRQFLFAACLLVLAACSTTPPIGSTAVQPSPSGGTQSLPPVRTFSQSDPSPPTRSNTEIARDIIDLTFFLESGVELPYFTRFDQPITIALSGRTTAIFDLELDRLIGRFKREAKLDVRRLPDGSVADVSVVGVTRHELQRIVPSAACFVLPARITWAEFSANPRQPGLNWTNLKRRDAASVFIPSDISPQEVRDCLHEEIAQALGPLNDLYRLEDSVFNDDNMNSVLTGFDMLVLRTIYDPALANGMSRQQVAAALPGILSRINPRGNGYTTRAYQPSPRDWTHAMERALGPDNFGPGRRRAARQAVDIANREGWNDTRLGLSLLTMGRLASPTQPELALSSFLGAAEVYRARPATQIHAATASLQIAAFALAGGETAAALRIADHNIPVAKRAENAALLADFLFIRAASLDAMGQPSAAREARLDALGWARYGLGSDSAVRERAAEIAALAPAGKGQS